MARWKGEHILGEMIESTTSRASCAKENKGSGEIEHPSTAM